ncbi:hypothetical protein PDESU_01657 [Pontiella desulfatans]|uniref:Cellobiose phosphorylase n=1 Tax=Pontiella desulfatans TaxID=2750659 RepID=A0A6C2TZS0_PONDE|nr:hypothetical protein [Pontiella desulfatans]VGO13103.1 hypothetical protein PDESU_01657 [Pontiella desulfatans]
MTEKKKVWVGDCELYSSDAKVNGGYTELDGEQFYRIRNHDRMAPFFISVVSDSNHWMFISSNGALTCGRRNPESALFPYYTEDQVQDAAEQTGSKTVVLVEGEAGENLWEPFSSRYDGVYDVERNIYKNVPGNKLVFEEVNRTLKLSFSYVWMSSDRFGFVRKATLANLGGAPVRCRFVDGLQNLLPANVDRNMQNVYSTLVDAYKKSELLPESGIGIYALSSVPVDRAEPSESLTANTVWSMGLDQPVCLLSTGQLERFRRGETIEQETDMRGVRGAYFVQSQVELPASDSKEWVIVAEVDQDACDIAALELKRPDADELLADVEQGTENLCSIVAAADGIQTGGNPLQTARHFANTLFNVMRGGIFDNGYSVSKTDLLDFISSANGLVAEKLTLDALPDTFQYQEGLTFFRGLGHPEMERLYLEYMPLTFSRRHGDPSRPWNQFSIETRNPDGSKKLSYEGNWRDIFQNWEALGISYPGFFESIISKFVNASTADGYNPYRITRDGMDWEVHDPNDPWSYIGYWGDHQIIYLLKLLEQSEAYHPGNLKEMLSKEIYVYANVPYSIKSYDSLLADPCESIEFDHDAHAAILALSKTIGSDGKLVYLKGDGIYRVNLTEKLLVPLLAKLSNFIPEAGIWMNTQRPEWNDANNALVGYGVSMVTLCYMRRYLDFCIKLFDGCGQEDFAVSTEVEQQFRAMFAALQRHAGLLPNGFSAAPRREVLDLLGGAGDHYRKAIYNDGFSGQKTSLPVADIVAFMKLSLAYMDQTIAVNRRDDGLYHAYNLMKVEADGGISVRHLYEMLEGQVAVLSSGKLDAEESLDVLKALRTSSLYREDQHSYILYPNRTLQRFMEKNCIPDAEEACPGIAKLDSNGVLHFNPEFRNAAMLDEELKKAGMSGKDRDKWLETYEQVFDHQSFTGRSGTFFKYEGLGSIYWHMVSKLLLAVQETCIRAKGSTHIEPLLDCYYDIRQGIGAYKSVQEQGAFPTDPYSHTPSMMGAQQPGLTGQVKEDFISRLTELGVRVENGCLGFDPFLSSESDVCFTFCTVPVEIREGDTDRICVKRATGETIEVDGLVLNQSVSSEIFTRTGAIEKLNVEVRV